MCSNTYFYLILQKGEHTEYKDLAWQLFLPKLRKIRIRMQVFLISYK